MSAQITADELFESLNGYDEIAIEKYFGKNPMDLANTNQFTLMRSLVFVQERRAGLDDKAAKDVAMALSIKGLQERFVENNEVIPDEPVTPAGEASAPSE